MKKILTIIIVLIIIGGGIYYFASNNNSNPAPVGIPQAQNAIPNTSNSNNSKAVNSAPVNIDIKNFTFNPSVLSIKAGTNVVWTNNDTVPHTITSDSGDFDSGTIAPGGSYNHTFSSAGSTKYHCNIHRTMKGEIVVQ